MRVIFVVLIFFIGVHGADCKKVRTGFKHSVAKSESSKNAVEEIEADEELIREIVFSGFDKKSSSTVESFFVTNKGNKEIEELSVRISYLTKDGRLLHRREEKIKVLLPPGETRQVEIKSWDKQRSFHYVGSLGKHGSTTGFDVQIELLSVKIYN